MGRGGYIITNVDWNIKQQRIKLIIEKLTKGLFDKGRRKVPLLKAFNYVNDATHLGK